MNAIQHVTAFIAVSAPAEFSRAFLGAFARKPQPEGRALPDSFVVESIESPVDRLSNVISVSWKAKGVGPHPSFHTVVRCTKMSAERSLLTIGGEYSSPGAISGNTFDAGAGIRIARALLERLLGTFRD